LLFGLEEASWLTRNALETCDDFECARSLLKNTWTNSLVYFTLAGTKDDEGVIISRNLHDVAHEEKLDVENGKWFIAQTNDDHFDDRCYYRCEEANNNLNKVGRDNINKQTMGQIVTRYPNFNYGSIYTNTMVAMEGYMSTTVLLCQSETHCGRLH
jgi:hypothetical protein